MVTLPVWVLCAIVVGSVVFGGVVALVAVANELFWSR